MCYCIVQFAESTNLAVIKKFSLFCHSYKKAKEKSTNSGIHGRNRYTLYVLSVTNKFRKMANHPVSNLFYTSLRCREH